MDERNEEMVDSEGMPDIKRDDLDGPDWKVYQKIVAGLHADEDTRVETEYQYPIPGSGEKEVDVVVWDQSDHYEYTVLIECKFHDDPVSQSVIDSINGYLFKSDADKAVVVSKSGFQSGAIDRAEGTGVELLTLRQFVPETDLQEDAVRYLNLDLKIRRRNLDILDMDVEPLEEDPGGEEEEKEIRLTHQNSHLYTSDKEPLNESLAERLTEFKQSKNTGTHTEDFDDAALLIEGNFFRLNSIKYEVTESIGGEEYSMDLFRNIDLYFYDELTGDEEYESLSQALTAFREHVRE